MTTKIEWTDETINPIIGCSKTSPGCLNCYAEKMAMRLKAIGARGYSEVVDANGWTGKTSFVESELEKPYRWKKPRNIFVGSMTDLFHESVPDKWLNSIFHMIEENPEHTIQILTKRADDALEYLKYQTVGFATLPNFWFGITAENHELLFERWGYASQIPASVIFVSYEPALGPLDITVLERKPDWVICGGESGYGARPMNPEWVRSLRDQCVAAGVPFFFKGWGGVIKNNTGRLLDGMTWDEFPIIRNGGV